MDAWDDEEDAWVPVPLGFGLWARSAEECRWAVAGLILAFIGTLIVGVVAGALFA